MGEQCEEKWRTMDTAPTDGTEILCISPNADGPIMAICVYNENFDQWCPICANVWVDMPAHFIARRWMPLPPPPKHRAYSKW